MTTKTEAEIVTAMLPGEWYSIKDFYTTRSIMLKLQKQNKIIAHPTNNDWPKENDNRWRWRLNDRSMQ